MKDLWSSVLSVFFRPKYVGIASATAALVFSIAVWLPNYSLIFQIFASNSIVVSDKAGFLWGLYGSLATNFTAVSATYTVLISVLFGLNIALFTYYIKQRQGTIDGNASALGIGGLVSGFFGIGCAACGTFVLTSLLSVVGGAGALAFLPFGGEEFGVIGVGLLFYSLYKLAQMIEAPKVC